MSWTIDQCNVLKSLRVPNALETVSDKDGKVHAGNGPCRSPTKARQSHHLFPPIMITFTAVNLPIYYLPQI